MHQEQSRPIIMAHAEENGETLTVAVDVLDEPGVRRHPADGIVRDVRSAVVADVRPRRATGILALLGIVAAGVGVARVLDLGARAAKRRRRMSGITLATSALAGAALVRFQLARLFSAEPEYELELSEGDFEIRRYPALNIAQTRVSGAWREGLDEGFRRLAHFIFGGNVARDPRTLTAGRDHHPRKLAMTTPVISQREGEHHIVAFVMPPGETLESLPVPQDASVSVDMVSPRRVAVLRFRGRYTTEAVRAKQEELFALVEAAGLTPAGEPVFAAYDAPSTLPILRRDEVWLPIA